MKNQSWKVEVKATGEKEFISNALRFVTEDEANKQQEETISRMATMITEIKVSESTDTPNYVFIGNSGATPMVSTKAIIWAFSQVMANREEKSLNYAVEYARYGLHCSEDELKIQAIYVLGNISRWKGDTAKKCRAILKAFTKQ